MYIKKLFNLNCYCSIIKKMATDLNKLLRAQAQKQKQQIKKIVAGDKGGAQSKRRPQAQTLTGLKNIQGEEQEVRSFFNNVDDDNIAEELQRFMNSKAVWKGRRSFFQRFMGLVPEEQYAHFKEKYLNQGLDFKQFFDDVYKPKFIDTDIFYSGRYDEILRKLFHKYLTLSQTEYVSYEEELLHNISVQMNTKAKERFEDMLNIFNNDIDDKEKFAQLFIENNLPFEDFYLKYMGGDYDVAVQRDVSKVEEEPEKPKRRPLMIDEQGNVVEIPGHNLYTFEGPRNRLPILSREQFRKTIEEGQGIQPQVIELAKIELKTNLNLSNNQIDEIINGLTEKYHKVNKFILKLGEIILYYVNNFVIRNQENRIASLYRDRIDNNLIKLKKLAYAKKVDFLPELFQFNNPDEVSVNMVSNFIDRQLQIFLENFKNKLYVYITNITAKAKNIHIGINNVIIISNVKQTDYFMFGYTNNNGENIYFDIRNMPDNLPKKLKKRLDKIYSLREEAVGVLGEEVKKEVDEDEVIDIEQIYDMFVQSLDEMNLEIPEEESGSESVSESGSEGDSESDDPVGFLSSDDEAKIRIEQQLEQQFGGKKFRITPTGESWTCTACNTSNRENDKVCKVCDTVRRRTVVKKSVKSSSEEESGEEDSDSDSDYVEPEESEEETEEEGKGAESEEEESSESEDESLKDTIRIVLRKTISDMIKNKLTVGRQEKNLPPVENKMIDNMIIKNSANIEQSITDIFRDYGTNHGAIFNKVVGQKKMLEYLKVNIPDIFKDEVGEPIKPKKQKTILDSDSESEAETKAEGGSESDCPGRIHKCIKCGKETSENLNLKTKIKDGDDFKTVCFCSFNCFERYKR